MKNHQKFGIAIHGGCGVRPRIEKPLSYWSRIRGDLLTSLYVGHRILRSGGSAVEAVKETIVALENCEFFNAGRGAAFNEDGEHELDAGIMDGGTLKAGAVCGVKLTKNPIQAAYLLLNSEVVILSSTSADEFSRRMGLEIVSNDYFSTDHQRIAFNILKSSNRRDEVKKRDSSEKKGTVGAVALDSKGNLAAGTSTGGYNNKPSGRIGDSPIIGAGTYARNGSCAISCTGHGEAFIKNVLAYDVVARMVYLGQTLEEATNHAIQSKSVLEDTGGGLVAIDFEGNICAPFNTVGMARAWVDVNGFVSVGIHDFLEINTSDFDLTSTT